MKVVPDRIEGLESIDGGSDDEWNGQLDGLGHGPRQPSRVDLTGAGDRCAREISQVLDNAASALALNKLSEFFRRSKDHRRAVTDHAGAHDGRGAFRRAILT